jgi:hypothetical protein
MDTRIYCQKKHNGKGHHLILFTGAYNVGQCYVKLCYPQNPAGLPAHTNL